MTRERLITVKEGVSKEEAQRLLHQHRSEKLLGVDDDYVCIGLITGTALAKAQAYPPSCTDEQGRLRAPAAIGVGPDALARREALPEADVAVSGVGTPHGTARKGLGAWKS